MRLEIQHGEFSARVSGWSMRRVRKLAKLAVDLQPVVSEPAVANESFGFSGGSTLETTFPEEGTWQVSAATRPQHRRPR